MNIDPIIVAMVSSIDMLDAAEPDEVEPSYAVKVQQAMGGYLQELPSSEEPKLRAVLLRIAGDVSEREPNIARYLRRWAGNLADS